MIAFSGDNCRWCGQDLDGNYTASYIIYDDTDATAYTSNTWDGGARKVYRCNHCGSRVPKPSCADRSERSYTFAKTAPKSEKKAPPRIYNSLPVPRPNTRPRRFRSKIERRVSHVPQRWLVRKHTR